MHRKVQKKSFDFKSPLGKKKGDKNDFKAHLKKTLLPLRLHLLKRTWRWRWDAFVADKALCLDNAHWASELDLVIWCSLCVSFSTNLLLAPTGALFIVIVYCAKCLSSNFSYFHSAQCRSGRSKMQLGYRCNWEQLHICKRRNVPTSPDLLFPFFRGREKRDVELLQEIIANRKTWSYFLVKTWLVFKKPPEKQQGWHAAALWLLGTCMRFLCLNEIDAFSIWPAGSL